MADSTNVDAYAIRQAMPVWPKRWWPATQAEFAALLGVPVATVRCWEQGRRKPDAAARTLLRLIQAAPAEMKAALEKVAEGRGA